NRSAERHDRAPALPVELHVSRGDAQQTDTQRVHREGVGATEIDRGPRRRLDEEEARWRVDLRGDRPAVECQPVVAGPCGEEPEPSPGLYLDTADDANRHERARRIVRRERLADA